MIFYAGKRAFTRDFKSASLPLPHTRRRITMSRKLAATLLSTVVIAGGLFAAPASAAKSAMALPAQRSMPQFLSLVISISALKMR